MITAKEYIIKSQTYAPTVSSKWHAISADFKIDTPQFIEQNVSLQTFLTHRCMHRDSSIL